MKKFLCCLLALLLSAAVLSVPVCALEGCDPDFSVGASAAYLVNTDTNIVVYEKNSEKQLTAASLTKLMTMLLLLQSYQDQLDNVSVTAPQYIYDILYGKNASTADIRSGETHTLRNLLYAMELPSGNEAAYIVADYMGGGSIDAFVARMNQEAEAIGCTGTVFTDPCGLGEGNLTTARDAYLILRALLAYDAFVQAAGATTYDMGTNSRYPAAGSYLIRSTNKMMVSGEYYRDYTQGGKTGTLGDWQNFAGWHVKNSETYISVVLHSPDAVDTGATPRPALRETGLLMDWAYKTFDIEPALDTTTPITEIPVKYSAETDTLLLYPADNMMTLLPMDRNQAVTDQTYDLPDSVTAPIRQGDVVGTVTLSLNGELLGTVDLIAGSDVSRSNIIYTFSRIGAFFASRYFRLVVVLTLILVGAYFLLWAVSGVSSSNRSGR